MKRTVISSLLLLSLAIAIWWMSANAVWLGDDLDYKYMMKGEIWQSWGKIKTIRAFFESQWVHYLHVNGRYTAHALVQLFNAILGQQIFALCNAFVYTIFALLISKTGGVRPTRNPGGLLSAICLSVLCFITKMMPTCQIGYIWGMTANLAWMMLFFRDRQPSWWMTVVMMILGIIVGNWQECVSIGICGGIGIWWTVQTVASYRRQERHFDWRRSWILIGYVIGTASNCLSPSTMGRVSAIELPLTDMLLIASYSFPSIALLAICIVYVNIRHGRLHLFSFSQTEGKIPEGVLFSGLLLLIVFNIAIGIYSNRQLFGANLFAAILILRILPHHRFGWMLNSLASIGVAALWILMINGMREVGRQYEDISRLHSESVDGSVHYDRTRVMTLGFPLRAKYYEDILGLFDNDLHHSLMKDFKLTKRGKTLKLKPTAALEEECASDYAPGHFTVIIKVPPKGEAPREILVYGHYPLGIPAKPRKMEVTKFSNRSKFYGSAVIVPEYPFFTADSIKIIER